MLAFIGGLWGAVFLGEPVGAGTLAGGLTALAAMALVAHRRDEGKNFVNPVLAKFG